MQNDVQSPGTPDKDEREKRMRRERRNAKIWIAAGIGIIALSIGQWLFHRYR